MSWAKDTTLQLNIHVATQLKIFSIAENFAQSSELILRRPDKTNCALCNHRFDKEPVALMFVTRQYNRVICQRCVQAIKDGQTNFDLQVSYIEEEDDG